MNDQDSSPENKIVFQGAAGAYSHIACRESHPDMEAVACPTFEDAFAAVREGRARLAMIPVENSVAGRVADIHSLLPESGLYIVGEYYQRVHHHLLAPEGASLDTVRRVHSHVQALTQCRNLIRSHGFEATPAADTAGAAAMVAREKDASRAAIASELAGKINGLVTLEAGIEDEVHNTTRFLIMSRAPDPVPQDDRPIVTSFVFRVKNIPAALYKALGGFATNGVNMTKLESYIVNGNFIAAQFYADVEARPDERPMQLAMEELEFFSHEVIQLGSYPAHPYRFEVRKTPEEE